MKKDNLNNLDGKKIHVWLSDTLVFYGKLHLKNNTINTPISDDIIIVTDEGNKDVIISLQHVMAIK